MKNTMNKYYLLTIHIFNPSNPNNIETINMWTDITPDDLDVPATILQNGFKYLSETQIRFVPPHQILSLYYTQEPVEKPRGYHLLQI